MFTKIITDNTIPPNFLNSILTNPSLYEMFKNDFSSNAEYFQGIKREEYLSEMLKFIEDTLFSTNIFHIYSQSSEIEDKFEGKLSYMRNFYDDFLLDEFKKDPDNILKTRIFRGLEFAKQNDQYASLSSEFNALYDYVFKESLDYFGIIEVLMKEPLRILPSVEPLSMKDFDTICNFVKNNISGCVDMDIVTNMLKRHAYKINRIFDVDVVSEIVKSTIVNYLSEFGIEVRVEFLNGLDTKDKSSHSVEPNIIQIDSSLLDGFVMLNYVELFEHAFYEAEMVKDLNLLRMNKVDYPTLKTIMNMITLKVDIESLLKSGEYRSNEFYMDARASSFIKTLRFFGSFGVPLFTSYINSKMKDLEIDFEEEEVISKKELSLDQRFQINFTRLPNKQALIKSFSVLKIIFDKDGNQIPTIDLIKMLTKEEMRDFLIEYLHSRIIDPARMIDDVNDLTGYKTKDEFLRSFIESELKYIYVDTFYYSLESFMKMNKNTKLDLEECLDDLLVKVNCIKDTPLTHRFIDEAIFTIMEMKQNI